MIRIKFLVVVLPINVLALQGCTVLAIAAAGLATDAAIGTARLGGKAIGAAAGLAISGSSDEKR